MDIIRARILRKGEEVKVPMYETRGAVGFDLAASEEVIVPAGKYAFQKTGLVVEIPQGYMLGLFARSSTGKKTGLMPFNCVGVIDNDYCGVDDELMVCWFNTNDFDVKISVGERLAQGVFMRVGVAEFEDMTVEGDLGNESRGGFGSTD